MTVQQVLSRTHSRRATNLCFFAFVTLAVVVAGCGTASRTAPARDPNVVLIVVDSLRADHLGAYGYSRNTSPHVDRLAREGVVFENAVSSASWTMPAIGSLFTSLHPHIHRATGFDSTLPTEAVTLAETLKTAGYVTIGFQANPILSDKAHFDQGFDSYRETPSTVSRRQARSFDRWLEENSKDKFFAYFHMMDTHLPYAPAEDNRAKFVQPYSGPLAADEVHKLNDVVGRLSTLTDADRGHVIDLYDATVNQTDDTIGTIVADLTERKLIDDTIIIITADHGEELFDHGGFEHGHSMYRELTQIPLIIRNPRLDAAGVRVKQLVRLIDIYPTLIGFLKVTTPSFLMGRDLTPAIADPNLDWELDGFSEGVIYGPHQSALEMGGRKLIRIDPIGVPPDPPVLDALRRRPGWNDQTGVIEFFDLKRDPREHQPLADHPEKPIWGGLLETLRTANSRVSLAAAPKAIDKEMLEDLKSLGYVGR